MLQIPKNQIDIYEILNAPAEEKEPNRVEGVRWQQNPLHPFMADRVAYLLVEIPAEILSPLDLPGMYDQKLKKMQLWAAYVNAIGDGEGINFSAAKELLEKCRDERKSVKIRLNERFCDIFEELIVIEYL